MITGAGPARSRSTRSDERSLVASYVVALLAACTASAARADEAIPPPPSAPIAVTATTETDATTETHTAETSLASPTAPTSTEASESEPVDGWSRLAESTVAEVGEPEVSPEEKPKIRGYGIVWVTVFVTQPVQSYGFVTAGAPTAAANPAVFADRDAGLVSFQVRQSRAGIVVGEGTPVQGILEIDFIQFDLSSPTVQALPRIRIGEIQWKPRPNQKLFFGQTWDIFGTAAGSLNSHSVNLVGSLFEAGNVGFMRIQLGWMGRFGDWEVAAVSGLQGANNGNIYNNVELSMAPTVSTRLMYHLPRHRGEVGVAAMATSLRYTQGSAVDRRPGLGAVAFADLTLGRLELHAELYAAQNLQASGILNIARGRFGTSVTDIGGYLSTKYTLGRHAFTAMFGMAAVPHPSRVVPGYTPATPTTSAATDTNAGPGMKRNLSANIAYWFTPLRGFSITLEGYVFATRFKLFPSDVGVVPSDNVSFGGILGSMYIF